MNFAIPVDLSGEIKSNEKRDKYLDLARKLKKSLEQEDDGNTNCNWCAWNDPPRLDKWVIRIVNRRTNRKHLNYSIAKICRNTEKIPTDLRRLAVTRTQVKDH